MKRGEGAARRTGPWRRRRHGRRLVGPGEEPRLASARGETPATGGRAPWYGPRRGLARPRRFERPTSTSAGWRSIQLSYGRIEEAGTLANPPPGLRMAERVGFEPTVPFPVHALSRRVPSATRPPLRSPASLAFGSLRGTGRAAPRRAFDPCICFARLRLLSLASRAGWRRGRDSNPRYGFPYAGLANLCLQPLGHLSVRHRQPPARAARIPSEAGAERVAEAQPSEAAQGAPAPRGPRSHAPRSEAQPSEAAEREGFEPSRRSRA